MSNNILENIISKRETLISRFLKRRDPGLPEKMSLLFDEYFSQSYENSGVGADIGMSDNPYAIIALGGYGRKEQCIFSDIDLLFLFKKRVPKEAEDLVREMVYPLWDAGFEVGHSTRSIKECVKMAGDDLEILMSLLDGRFVCGMSSFFIEMVEGLRKKVIRFHAKKIISLIVHDNQSRHERYGESAYLLEPNLKEGQGGLRDFHTMLWVARIKSGLREPKDLEYSGYISENEYSDITEAVSFIRMVRNLLHYFTGRKCDQLNMEYQSRIAELMKFKKTSRSEPVETFLGVLQGHMEVLKQQHLIFLSELGFLNDTKFSRNIMGMHTGIKGLVVTRNNTLEFSSLESVLDAPELLMLIFEESAKLKIPLSANAKRVIRDFSYLVEEEFKRNPKFTKVFENVLVDSRLDANALYEMKYTGFLSKFIPEFDNIGNFIQYNSYHIYPVDIHSLKTVQVAKGFGNSQYEDALCVELYGELEDKSALMYACLFHDIGKGVNPENHSKEGALVARQILVRMGCPVEKIETVIYLIRQHLLLGKIATRRDLNDEETIIFCARKIRDVERLKMLYLLSVADRIATGEKAWGEWNSALLKDLFFKVFKMLKKGELATSEAVASVEGKKLKIRQSLMQMHDAGKVKQYLDILSPRYFTFIQAEDIVRHYSIYEELGDNDFVWDIKKDPDANSRIVTICAKNCPGFFSKVAGTFTLSDIDILDAQIYTWKNDIVLDVFNVTPPADLIFEDECWDRIKKRFQKVITGELDFSEQISIRAQGKAPEQYCSPDLSHQVRVDNDSSGFFTIIEVVAFDVPGLLFKITDALFRCGLDIHVAKVGTKIDQVMDVFYVRNFMGEKVDQEEDVDRIKSEITKII